MPALICGSRSALDRPRLSLARRIGLACAPRRRVLIAASAAASRVMRRPPGGGARSRWRAAASRSARCSAPRHWRAAPEAGEPGLGGGEIAFDLGGVARRRDALRIRSSTAARSSCWLATNPRLSADQRAVGEDVVPGGDRVERDPVGARFGLGGGRAQPGAGGEHPKCALAPKSNRVWLTERRASVRCAGRERSMMLCSSLEKSRAMTL
jgi:hypothetical protein